MNTDIEHVYVNIFGDKYEMDIDLETLDKLESSKTITEPIADDIGMQQIGTVSIVYKGTIMKKNLEKHIFRRVRFISKAMKINTDPCWRYILFRQKAHPERVI